MAPVYSSHLCCAAPSAMAEWVDFQLSNSIFFILHHYHHQALHLFKSPFFSFLPLDGPTSVFYSAPPGIPARPGVEMEDVHMTWHMCDFF